LGTLLVKGTTIADLNVLKLNDLQLWGDARAENDFRMMEPPSLP
jgi:hypothetical protein